MIISRIIIIVIITTIIIIIITIVVIIITIDSLPLLLLFPFLFTISVHFTKGLNTIINRKI